MQDVRSTVQEALNSSGYGSYSQYAEPVITALVNRERDICGVLIEYATQQGMSRENVVGALSQAGMAVPAATAQPTTEPRGPVGVGMASGSSVSTPTPAATSQGAGDPDIGATLRDIQTTLSGLVQFARNNGYNG